MRKSADTARAGVLWPSAGVSRNSVDSSYWLQQLIVLYCDARPRIKTGGFLGFPTLRALAPIKWPEIAFCGPDGCAGTFLGKMSDNGALSAMYDLLLQTEQRNS